MLRCLLILITLTASASADLSGRLEFNRQPVPNATVELWVTGTASEVKPLASTKTNKDGTFRFADEKEPSDAVHYFVARFKATNAETALLCIPGTEFAAPVVINELTTVASAFTSAQFFDGTRVSGNALGMQIAANNTANLVNPANGTWGDVLLNPFNSTQNTTLVRLNTLASLLTAYGTVENDGWRHDFLKAATPVNGTAPKDTLQAIAGIAKSPWAHPDALYELFNKAYPQPRDGFPYKQDSNVPASRRTAPFVPYLAYEPDDFAMVLAFAGGGVYAPGKLRFDHRGNLWSGQNWMPGSQSGCFRGIGGGVVKLTPTGQPRSPAISGFTGMGIDGVGWGTGVSNSHVWASSFNGSLLVTDFDGNPIATADDLPDEVQNQGGLQGVTVAPNGDVWIAATSADALVHFPGGDVSKGEMVHVDGLSAPFAVVVDQQNRVWVSNTTSDYVLSFPADDPSAVQKSTIGIAARGVALDSKGNCWVACNANRNFPPAATPSGISILEQFAIAYPHLVSVLGPRNTTGVVNMISGNDPSNVKSFHGDSKIKVPWGVSIDGNDDAWVANWLGRSIILLAGAEPDGRTAGHEPGDLIHEFRSGSFQMLTDAVIDPAGNVWGANNWNVGKAVIESDPSRPFSTWGGGSGIVVVYGVATPVKTPLVGPVQASDESVAGQ